MFEKILKGARSGQPGAGGVKGVSHKNAPIAGHPYHQKTTQELQYIMADANEAAKNMKGWNDAAESKYLDQVNDASTVLGYRRRNNLSDIDAADAAKKFQDKITQKSEGFVGILKGARSGQPGAGGVKHPGMKQKNISTGDWKNVPTEQLKAAIGAFAPHAASSDQNKEIAAAMVKELGSRGKDHPDDELVSVGPSWNGGGGSKEKMHAIPKPPADLATVPKATLKAIGRDLKKQTGRGYTDDYMYPFEAHQSEDGKRVALVTRMGSVGSGGLHTGYMTTLVENDGAVWKHKGTVASDYKASWSGSMSDRHVPSIISKFVGYKVQDKSKSKKNEGWRGFFGI